MSLQDDNELYLGLRYLSKKSFPRTLISKYFTILKKKTKKTYIKV